MLTWPTYTSVSPLRKDKDVLKMGRSRRRVGARNGTTRNAGKTPGERRESANGTLRNDVDIASFIVDVVFIIFLITLVFLFIRF